MLILAIRKCWLSGYAIGRASRLDREIYGGNKKVDLKYAGIAQLVEQLIVIH